jgi:predicted outer membrane protein
MITKFSVALSLAFVFASPCFAQDSASQKFLKEAIEGNFAEVQMGQLAKKQASSDGVRSFGEMLEKDHSAANQKATAAATSLGMTAPTSPNKKQTADYDKMSKLSGAQFDKMFVSHMIADHKKDIKDYEKAAKKKDAASSYATDTLPTLRKHLDTAQSLSAGKTASPTENPSAVIAVPAPAAGVPAPVPDTTAGEKVR